MAQPAAAADQQGEQHEHHARHAEVGARHPRTTQLPQQHAHATAREIAAEEFRPACDVSPVWANRNARFPLTRPRNSALLRRIGNGLSLWWMLDARNTRSTTMKGLPSDLSAPRLSIFLSIAS